MRYIQLEEAIFHDENEKFTYKIARIVEGVKALIRIGFTCVCTLNGVKLFRKRQSGVGVSESGIGEI
ncbi:hypothetical protein DRO61_05980 [Candidatus Bathyarchaeota archaeon]|jgi:hypothetical protein|nr:MAG: hypothetical protein DRO61_05980 [Candidatus Bathyarchaeota archaeon]